MAYLCYFIQDAFLQGLGKEEEITAPGGEEGEEDEEERPSTSLVQQGNAKEATKGTMPTSHKMRRASFSMGQNSSTDGLFEDENCNETSYPPIKRVSTPNFYSVGLFF